MPTTEPDASSLIALIHADPKVGKTWLVATAPKPLLILDAEGGSKFLPQLRKVYWDPSQPPPPAGDWDVAIVQVTDYSQVVSATKWLGSGKHPFVSVAVDTLTEVQKRALDSIVGVNPDSSPDLQDWGRIFRHMETLVRSLRDIANSPINPLRCLVLTAHSTKIDGKLKPLVKGQLVQTLPGFPDVIGWLHTATDNGGKIVRRLTIQPILPHVLAGDRTHILSQKLGADIERPNLTRMLEIISSGMENH